MNIVNLVGRLGKDVELRQAGDNKVTSLSLATTDGFGDNKKTNWHNVSFWNKQAEALAKYCSKGSQLAITGSIDYYQDKEGNYRTQIKGISFEFIGGSGQGNNNQQGYQKQPNPTYEKSIQTQPKFDSNNFDDDIPF